MNRIKQDNYTENAEKTQSNTEILKSSFYLTLN